MKIQYASDLHLEFLANSGYLQHNPLEVVADILILAGDIGCLREDGNYAHPFWDWASENYKQVIVVIGNHELYHYYDIDKLSNNTILPIRKNIAYHYNSVVHIEDIDIIVSTLWSKIAEEDAMYTRSRVSDFRQILDGDGFLEVKRFNFEHKKCVDFLCEAIEKSTANKIVIATHHVPSELLSSPDFNGSRINGAFVTELREFIELSKIDYWIYGHSHRNIDRIIGKTYCVSNQLGYVAHEDISSFDRGKYIEFTL